MAWCMKISLFYYQNTRNFKPLSTTPQGCLYVVVRFMAVFSTLTPDYATHLVNGMPRIGKPNTTRTVPFTDL
ncbi:hypothetical protein VN0638_08840 [Helicobacter pylori]|nr:hypothetical protein VN0638_08840 [Helicobacter pylori]GHS00434.1 hypothetical protein VN1281_07130 [Helicobacter pylori]